MSAKHKSDFERIKREYQEVVAVLTYLANRRFKAGELKRLQGLPSFELYRLEAAVASLNDACALLLLTKSEGFLREYISSLGLIADFSISCLNSDYPQ